MTLKSNVLHHLIPSHTTYSNCTMISIELNTSSSPFEGIKLTRSSIAIIDEHKLRTQNHCALLIMKLNSPKSSLLCCNSCMPIQTNASKPEDNQQPCQSFYSKILGSVTWPLLLHSALLETPYVRLATTIYIYFFITQSMAFLVYTWP